MPNFVLKNYDIMKKKADIKLHFKININIIILNKVSIYLHPKKNLLYRFSKHSPNHLKRLSQLNIMEALLIKISILLNFFKNLNKSSQLL